MGKQIKPEVKDEIIRLRVEDRWSSVEIGRYFDLSFNYVCSLLKKFPLTPEERTERCRQNAAKMRATALKNGKNYTNGKLWTKEEDKKIRSLWRTASWSRIETNLTNRSQAAIGRRASQLGVRRMRTANSLHKSKSDPLLKALQEVRELRGITRKALADKIGMHHVHLANCELGNVRPSFFLLRAMLDALGCDVQLIWKDTKERIRGYSLWLPEDESILRELVEQGATVIEIAMAMRRHANEVEKKCKELGLTKSDMERNVSGMMRERLRN